MPTQNLTLPGGPLLIISYHQCDCISTAVTVVMMGTLERFRTIPILGDLGRRIPRCSCNSKGFLDCCICCMCASVVQVSAQNSCKIPKLHRDIFQLYLWQINVSVKVAVNTQLWCGWSSHRSGAQQTFKVIWKWTPPLCAYAAAAALRQVAFEMSPSHSVCVPIHRTCVPLCLIVDWIQ